MFTALLVVQVLLSIALIVLVLLQHGKGADAGAAFGSGASATVFGAQGSANFLSRSTAVLAALFFVNSLLLSSSWVMGDREAPASIAEQVAPAAPAETAPADLPDVPAPDVPAAPADLPQ